MKIIGQQQVEVALLRPAARNANRMDPKRYEKLRDIIGSAGFLQPVLARPTGTIADAAVGALEIIDGHHRVRAAESLGMKTVEAVVVDCSDEDAARLGVALNRLRGELDLTEVGSIFADLIDKGVDVDLLAAVGFTSDEVDTLIASAQQEVDEVPPSMDAVPEEQSVAEVTSPWLINLEFTQKDAYDRARRGLKRAAGKGNPLSDGLLRLLGEEAVS